MTQATVFPVRFGLQLPPPENIKSVEVFSEGGLDLTQTIIENRPGCASELVNFEASLTGGYRRINGYALFNNNVVPGTGPVLGVAVAWPNQVIAARQDASDHAHYNLYKAPINSPSSSWTQLNPATTILSATTNATTTLNVVTTTLGPGMPISGNANIPANTYIISITDGTHLVMSAAATGSGTTSTTFTNPLAFSTGMYITSCFYDWTGVVRTAFFDGVNFPYRWDATNGFLMLVGTAANPAPIGPQVGVEFEGYLFVGAPTATPGAIVWSAPTSDNDWAAADGAVTAIIGDDVTALAIWRQQLIIFCKASLNKCIANSLNVTGVSPPPAFQVQPITDKIGCLFGRSVRECNGDILFLAPDGIRPISGTFNIGDTEIGSISRPIHNIVAAINGLTTPPMAVTVHKKTQYRLFYPNPSTTNAAVAPGIMGSVRRFRDGNEGWEWTQLQGFQTTCVDSRYMSDGNEYVVHGDPNGFVFQQEQGNTLNGAFINEVYTTVPLELGDITTRKAIMRVTVFVTTDALLGAISPDLAMTIIYNYDAGPFAPTYVLQNVGNQAIQYDNGYKYDSGNPVVYGPVGGAAIRQLVQGSGFVVQIQLTYTGVVTNAVSYTVQGFQIEFFPAGRR